VVPRFLPSCGQENLDQNDDERGDRLEIRIDKDTATSVLGCRVPRPVSFYRDSITIVIGNVDKLDEAQQDVLTDRNVDTFAVDSVHTEVERSGRGKNSLKDYDCNGRRTWKERFC